MFIVTPVSSRRKPRGGIGESCPSGRKVQHWKCCVGQPTEGSNPSLSAESPCESYDLQGLCVFTDTLMNILTHERILDNTINRKTHDDNNY